MKRLFIFSVAVILVISLLLFSGCKEKSIDIIIYDYETEKTLVILNSVENTKKFKDFSGAFLKSGEAVKDVEEDVTYSVLLKDPKNSTYDIWYKVALFDGYVYARFDYDKMDDEYVNTFNEMAFTQEYSMCDNMSEEMFRSFLE